MNKILINLKAYDLTQRWLSQAIGISRTSISKWCRNEIQPTLTDLSKIAVVLGIEIHQLIEPTKPLTLTLERLKRSRQWKDWRNSGEWGEILSVRNIFDPSAPEAAWIVITEQANDKFIPLYSIVRFSRGLLTTGIQVHLDASNITARKVMELLFSTYSKRFDS